MKKLFFVIMIFSLFFLSGCSNKNIEISEDYILLSTSIDGDGNVLQSINFGVNSKRIKGKSKKQDEYFTFLSNLIKNLENLRKEYLFTFALKYMENPTEDAKINGGVILSNALYFAESDSVGFSIKYSPQAWNFYNTNSDKNSQNTGNEGNIFIKKSISKSKFIFSTISKENELVGERYKGLFLAALKGLSFENDMGDYHPDFVYSYSSPYNQIHSNADIVFSKENQTFHVWKVEEKELFECDDVIIWYSEINYGIWYLSALIIVLVPTIIFLTVYFVKNKKTRRVN